MTPLPHNPAITVIDLPEDAVNVKIVGNDLRYGFRDKVHTEYIILPSIGYKLICLGLQATEDEAREIVDRYKNGMYMCYTSPARSYRKATASLRSLITSNGWKNPVFLRKEK